MSKYNVGDRIVMTRTGIWSEHGNDLLRAQKQNGFVVISDIRSCNDYTSFRACAGCGVVYYFRHDPRMGRCHIEQSSYKYPFVTPKPKPFKLHNNEQI